MALNPFKSGTKELLERIRTRNWRSPEEKTAGYEQLATSTDIRLSDAIPHLFSPDVELRRAVGRLLAARKDPRPSRSSWRRWPHSRRRRDAPPSR